MLRIAVCISDYVLVPAPRIFWWFMPNSASSQISQRKTCLRREV